MIILIHTLDGLVVLEYCRETNSAHIIFLEHT